MANIEKKTTVTPAKAAKKAVKKTADKITKAAEKVEEKAEEKVVKAVKKAVPKKTATKKTETKKPTARKTAAKKTEVDSKVYIQFFGKQVTANDVLTQCEADYKSNNKAAVKSIEVYVKPEDDTAYYVVNGKTEGKISL